MHVISPTITPKNIEEQVWCMCFSFLRFSSLVAFGLVDMLPAMGPSLSAPELFTSGNPSCNFDFQWFSMIVCQYPACQDPPTIALVLKTEPPSATKAVLTFGVYLG